MASKTCPYRGERRILQAFAVGNHRSYLLFKRGHVFHIHSTFVAHYSYFNESQINNLYKAAVPYTGEIRRELEKACVV